MHGSMCGKLDFVRIRRENQQPVYATFNCQSELPRARGGAGWEPLGLGARNNVNAARARSTHLFAPLRHLEKYPCLPPSTPWAPQRAHLPRLLRLRAGLFECAPAAIVMVRSSAAFNKDVGVKRVVGTFNRGDVRGRRARRSGTWLSVIRRFFLNSRKD